MFEKIIFVNKEPLHIYPPVLSQLCVLSDLGYEIVCITSKTTKIIEEKLSKKSIKLIYIKNKRLPIPFLGKIINWLSYRRRVSKKIKKYNSKKSIIWFGTADSAIPLFGKLKKYSYVLTILELYDTNRLYRFFLSKIVKNALKIIECEENRAFIHASWWSLKSVPTVIPNKPYDHPRKKRISINNPATNNAIDSIRDKEFILYQGLINSERDISIIAEALESMDSNYYLVLMGKVRDNEVAKLKQIYSKTIYLGYVPAPDHLLITSYAKYGIAFYDLSSLNNVFCAPNKIYEYSGFGIPTIGNRVPGLINTLEKYDSGIIVDKNNKKDIINKIKKMDQNYEYYSRKSKLFYDSIDLIELFSHITKDLNIRKR